MTIGPLNGIRVVEITMFQQGPVAGMRLGDLGADVIKIEAKTGDPARGFMKIIGAMAGLSGRNYYFEHHNRNKRSLVMDLKTKKGMEILLASQTKKKPDVNKYMKQLFPKQYYQHLLSLSPAKFYTNNHERSYTHSAIANGRSPCGHCLYGAV